uniref:Dolichyl-phosphate beta-glucosyltransferase n=1 Tax=Oncorhynchus tshawytscha TaxID=74940 RepID=A0A8C8GM36_ONCTS
IMDCLWEIIHCLVGLAVAALIVVLLVAHLTAGMVDLKRHEKETLFPTATGEKEPFPSLHDPSSLELSVIVPEISLSLQKQQPLFTYEVIVVDDGSSDQTTEVALRYTRKYGADKVRVLTLVKNRGKGGAVRMGTLSSRGKLILMADADGATKFADVEKVEAGLHDVNIKPENMAISCGSRAHLEEEAVASRSMFRTFLMYGFHFLVWFFCVRGIKDTQCGFKLFTREAALKTFSSLHVERWAFDVELLYIAQCFKIPIAEVAVNWTEIEGSKLVPVWSWLQMGRDLVFIRLRYITGAWRLESPRKTD